MRTKADKGDDVTATYFAGILYGSPLTHIKKRSVICTEEGIGGRARVTTECGPNAAIGWTEIKLCSMWVQPTLLISTGP